jgi:hypothetical protein
MATKDDNIARIQENKKLPYLPVKLGAAQLKLHQEEGAALLWNSQVEVIADVAIEAVRRVQ